MLQTLEPTVRARRTGSSHGIALRSEAEQEVASAHWLEPGIEAVRYGFREGLSRTRTG